MGNEYWLDLLSGGGGTGSGIKMAGFPEEKIISVEYDPSRPELSKFLCDAHEANIGGRMIRKPVQYVAENIDEWIPEEIRFLSASPVCCNYSQAKLKDKGEKKSDVEIAEAIATIVSKKKPEFVFIENVPYYAKEESGEFIHESFRIIYNQLIGNGYYISINIVNVADYGLPTSRKRLLLIANKGDIIPKLPAKASAQSWFEAVKDLIYDSEGNILLEEHSKEFTVNQKKTIDKLAEVPDIFWVDRVSVCGKIRICNADKPLHAFTRQMFNDGKGSFGNSRNNSANIVIKGVPYKIPPRIFFRIQAFPEWYEIPDKGANVWGSIIGNSVPPLFAAKVFSDLYERVL